MEIPSINMVRFVVPTAFIAATVLDGQHELDLDTDQIPRPGLYRALHSAVLTES